MIIQHNMQAMFANRELGVTTYNKAKSQEKLSSGYKINRAADDAAGLTISENMRRNIRGLNQASRNIQDGISLVQIADGALNEDHEILQRMNELAVQAANGTNTVADRAAIQEEMKQLIGEVNRIANSTTFNEKIYPLNHGSISDVQPNKPAETLIEETIDVSSLADGDYNGYTYHDGNLTITDKGTYTIKNTLDGVNQSLRIMADADISLQNAKFHAESGACITVEKNVNVILRNMSGLDGRTEELADHPNIGFELKDNSTLTFENGNEASIALGQPTLFALSNTMGGFALGNSVTINLDSVDLIIPGSNVTPLFANDLNPPSATMNLMHGGGLTSSGNVFHTDYWPLEAVNVWTGFAWLGKDNADLDTFHFWGESHEILNYSTAYLIQSECESENQGPEYLNPNNSLNGNPDEIWIQAGDDAGEGMVIHTVDARAHALGIDGINVGSETGARNAIDIINNGIDKVSRYRSYFGAMQNRLEYAMAIDDNTAENTQAAESQIRDADMATEMMKFTKENILQQAGQAMLSQTNQSRQGILSLLQ